MTMVFDLLVVAGILLVFSDKPWLSIVALACAVVIWIFFCGVHHELDDDFE